MFDVKCSKLDVGCSVKETSNIEHRTSNIEQGKTHGMEKLTARDIIFGYGETPLLQGVSLTVSQGDFKMLLGCNGSGKSTLLGVLTGRLAAQGGRVELGEKALAEWTHRERAKALGIVMQTTPPVLDFTVEEMVMMGRHAYLSRLGNPTEEDEEKVAEAMETMEVSQFAKRTCNRLSGGERQRVMIAAALAQEPNVLLLDEPTSAQDPGHAVKLMEVLKTLPSHPGILMVVHDIHLARYFANEAVLLHHGKIFAEGLASDVLTKENIETVYGKHAVGLMRF